LRWIHGPRDFLDFFLSFLVAFGTTGIGSQNLGMGWEKDLLGQLHIDLGFGLAPSVYLFFLFYISPPVRSGISLGPVSALYV
jgi:hypothetical protein